ncbi:hypothetical protein AB0J68_01385 [Micromonospora sp. NPDC049580]|uniref:hypothetical protein n=1 Tax=Micromonospora sp. NPDC049580 TaxID=3154832 RepID=UPI0034295232
MSTDIDTAVTTGLPWPTTGTEPARQGGRHRWNKGGPVDAVGRRIITNPVSVDYNPLRPADRTALAPHHWADPNRYLPAPEMERTGRMDTTAVLDERQPAGPEQPANRGLVLAMMRDELTSPPEILAAMEQWVVNGCPTTDETTTPGGDQ